LIRGGDGHDRSFGASPDPASADPSDASAREQLARFGLENGNDVDGLDITRYSACSGDGNGVATSFCFQIVARGW
jgi:hypothetical protein